MREFCVKFRTAYYGPGRYGWVNVWAVSSRAACQAVLKDLLKYPKPRVLDVFEYPCTR